MNLIKVVYYFENMNKHITLPYPIHILENNKVMYYFFDSKRNKYRDDATGYGYVFDKPLELFDYED